MPERGPGRFLRDSLGVFGTQLLVTVLGVGTGVITARVLGPHDRGLFQLLVLLPATLANFAKLGIPPATVYFIRRRGASASAVASNSLWIALVLGGTLAAVCWAERDLLLGSVLKSAPPVTLAPVLALVPLVVLQTYFLGVLQAEERFREFNLQHVAPTVLGLVGMAVALLVFRAGLIGAVLTQAAIVAGMTGWLVLRVHRTAPLRARIDGQLVREMLGFGGKSYVQTLAASLHHRIDHYMIAFFLDPAQVGFYAIAVNLIGLLLKVPDAAGTVLYPRIAAAAEREMHAATSRACRYTVFITAAAAVGYALFGGIVVRLLFGTEFEDAIRPMRLMLPGAVMMSLYLILTRNFTSRNRQQVNIVAAVGALALNVALAWLLIPRFGIAGAAISTAVSYSVAALVLLVMFVRESGYTVGQTVLVGRADLGTLTRLATAGRR
jgi:O-antigen/teichoic acid export membrane protein